MSEVIVPSTQKLVSPEVKSARQELDGNPLPTASLSVPPHLATLRSGHLSLDMFSPVNQAGSFAFDQVLKSGQVHKRTRKTKVRLASP